MLMQKYFLASRHHDSAAPLHIGVGFQLNAPTTSSNAPAQSLCLSIEVMHFQFLLPPDRRHKGPSLLEEDLRVSVFDAFIPMTFFRLHLIYETTIYGSKFLTIIPSLLQLA